MFERFLKPLAVVALVMAFIRPGSGAEADDSNPLGRSPDVVAKGREIYNTACTVCHGVDGAAGDRGPALAAARRYLRRTNAELFEAIRDGIDGTGMPAIGLSEDDAWRVVAYIRSLRARASDLPVEGDVAAGAALFWGKAECGRCHMVRGRGGRVGPDLSDVGDRMSIKALEEALTVAKPHPPAGYEPAVIRLKSGTVLRGVLKNRHNFSYQLLDEEERLRLLSADEVESVDLAAQSLMPTDVAQRLSEDEFDNLLAYLSRLAR